MCRSVEKRCPQFGFQHTNTLADGGGREPLLPRSRSNGSGFGNGQQAFKKSGIQNIFLRSEAEKHLKCFESDLLLNIRFQRSRAMQPCFHLAYHVTDLDEARAFYGGLLGCKEGRSTQTWVDFNFFGHQVSLHLGKPFETTNTGKVGDHLVPMPHLGVVLDMETWKTLAQKLTDANLAFVIAPTVRFEGQPGEQSTMFFKDPSGNPIEIKGFADEAGVFAA